MQIYQPCDTRSDERDKAPGNSHIRFNMVEFDGADRLFANQVIDFSQSGIGIVSHEPIPIGQTLRLTLIVSGNEYYLNGCVRWCLEVDTIPTYHAGIHIVPDDGEDYRRWSLYCSH